MTSKTQYQRHKSHKISSGIAVGQFDGNGNVLSSKEVIEKRERKGLCRICGTIRTHQRTAMGRTILITKPGECLEGWCLKCHTVEQVLAKPGVRARLEKANAGRSFPGKSLAVTPRRSSISAAEKFGENSSLCSNNISEKSLVSPESKKAQDSEDAPDSAPQDSQVPAETSADVNICDGVSPALPITTILSRMRKGRKNPAVQEMCFLDLARSMADRSKVSQRDLGIALHGIISGMKEHSNSLGVQRMGCAALDALISSSPDSNTNREWSTKMAADGGVCAVIECMTNHLEARSLQRDAMRVLRNVLRNTRRNRKLCFMGSTEFTAIVNTMEAHAHSKSIQVIAWQILDDALLNVSATKCVRENKVLRAKLLELAKRHPKECETIVARVRKAAKV